MATISRESGLENIIVTFVEKNKIFESNAHFLNTCAQLGYANKQRIKVKKPDNSKSIKSSTFHNLALDSYIWMLAFAETNDPFIFDDEDECFKIFEEYANGGYQLISKEISKKSKNDAIGIETFISLLKRTYSDNGGVTDAGEVISLPSD